MPLPNRFFYKRGPYVNSLTQQTVGEDIAVSRLYVAYGVSHRQRRPHRHLLICRGGERPRDGRGLVVHVGHDYCECYVSGGKIGGVSNPGNLDNNLFKFVNSSLLSNMFFMKYTLQKFRLTEIKGLIYYIRCEKWWQVHVFERWDSYARNSILVIQRRVS